VKKLGKDRRLRRRIIAVFLFAVMLPSLIQVYLGLRYIKQEEQRQEQLVLRGLKVTLDGAAQKVEEDIHRALLQIFDSLTAKIYLPEAISAYQLHQFLSEHTLMEEVFVLDNKGRLLFPRTFRAQKESGTVQSVMSAVTRPWLIRGEESEARGKYDDAVDKYTTGLDACTFTRARLAFLVRIARCRLKTGDLTGANQTYRRVLAEDKDQFFGEEVPYQFVASFQLAQILEKTGQPGEAFDILARLYRNMLNEFQLFAQNQFMYYLSKVRTELQRHLPFAGPGAPAVLDSLILLEEAYMQEPVRNDFLKTNIVPSVEINLQARSEPNMLRYIVIQHKADSSIHIAFMDLGYLGQGTRIIGTRLHHPQLITLAEESLEGFDTEENLRVALLNEENDSLPSGEAIDPIIVEEPLPLLAGTMHGYKLALVGTQGTSIKEFTSRGVIPYYVLIFVIILVIALGVIFIFHDISREQELTRMKSEFISNVTHEIKTPIATIRSLAENVNEGWITSSEKQQDYFRLIARESERLGHLVENTLDFSRIEAGSKRYNMEVSSILEVIEKTVERFRILNEEEGIEISCDLNENLPPVRMDKVAMGQVLLNLLDNAAKYSPEEKVITLVVKKAGDHLKIAVTDKGIGINKKDIPRIFDKFYRSESGTGKNITGSGIGLTLVKEIVESHGGKVTVESKRNKGSTFTIRIPINQKVKNGEDITD
jgi:signal transduction histidine kinase/tetratricopeptide (TPR) repeat protein